MTNTTRFYAIIAIASLKRANKKTKTLIKHEIEVTTPLQVKFMAKRIEEIKASSAPWWILALIVVAIAGIVIGFIADTPEIPDPVVKTVNVSVPANLTEDQKKAMDGYKDLTTKFADDLREDVVYDAFVAWANAEHLEELEDELIKPAYLNLSDKDDLDNYNFKLSLVSSKLASYSWDDEDVEVEIEGILMWEHEDDGDSGNFDILVSGEYKEDNELKHEEIGLVA